MTPLEAIRIWGLEKLGRYYSSYRAFVLDPEPDDKHIGNILVHIPRVQGGMKIVARAKPIYGGPGYGIKYFHPNAGDIVWIEFENGNPTKPVWSYHTWAEQECPEELQDIHTAGFVTVNGSKIIFKEDESDSSLSIQLADGPEVEINRDQVTIKKEDSLISINKDKIVFNQGKNGGLVNVDILRSLITALQEDLTLAGSGAKLMEWQVSHQSDIEDISVLH